MTKRDFVVKVAKETGFVQNDVAVIVQQMIDCIAAELTAGKTVEFRNFGVFEVKVRKCRIGRNPKKPGETVVIPERLVVRFRAGKKLKKAVRSYNQ